MRAVSATCGVQEAGVEHRLHGVSLDIPAGAVTAVVGGDGAGKSTLLELLVGALLPDEGTVDVPRDPRRVGYAPTGAGFYADLTVEENVRFVAAAYGLGGEELTRRRETVLALTGLAGFGDRLARDLSGGMRQKLALALGTLHEPELLVLDEPTTGVDPVSRADLWRIIAGAASAGVRVVVATSYIDEAERAAHVVALHEGRVLLGGRPDEVAAATPGTLVDLELPTDRRFAWRRGAIWRQWMPVGPTVPDGRVVAPSLEDAVIVATLQASLGDTADTRPAADGSARPRTAGSSPAVQLELRGVARRFGDFIANDDVSFAVRAGEVVGLLGANGAGKTTAIRQALGLITPSAGEVRQFGELPSRRTRGRVGYLPQGLGLWEDLSVASNLEFVADAYGSPGDHRLPPDLAGDLDRDVGSLSLGRQRRVAFAAALEHDPELLVLDEPTSGVDALSRSRLWDVIRARAEAGTGVLVTTHSMDETRQCDLLLVMNRGRIVLRGTHDEIVGDQRVCIVDSDDWAAAFAALDAAGLSCGLVGRSVRVVDCDEATVRDVLDGERLEVRVSTAVATLEETMVAVVRGA